MEDKYILTTQEMDPSELEDTTRKFFAVLQKGNQVVHKEYYEKRPSLGEVMDQLAIPNEFSKFTEAKLK